MGEQIRAGDIAMLEHVKTKKLAHLSDHRFSDGKFEVNLSESSSGWKIVYFQYIFIFAYLYRITLPL